MFFSKKPKTPMIEYMVYRSKLVKYQQLIEQLKSEQDDLILLYFFDDTSVEVQSLLEAAGLSFQLVSANSASIIASQKYWLVDCHPSFSKMKATLTRIPDTAHVRCFLGMDEILMKSFSGSQLIPLMDKLGMKEEEAISHTFH